MRVKRPTPTLIASRISEFLDITSQFTSHVLAIAVESLVKVVRHQTRLSPRECAQKEAIPYYTRLLPAFPLPKTATQRATCSNLHAGVSCRSEGHCPGVVGKLFGHGLLLSMSTTLNTRHNLADAETIDAHTADQRSKNKGNTYDPCTSISAVQYARGMPRMGRYAELAMASFFF